MRVLAIIHTMGHGGAENIFRWLAWGLRREGLDVVAGIPLNNDPVGAENWITPAIEELGIPCETFDRRGSGYDLVRSFVSLIRRVKPDIVHSHLLDANFYSAVACRWLSVPQVSTEHGDIALNPSLAARAKFSLLPLLSDAVVCVSEQVRRRASTMTVFRGRLEMIHNGIALPKDEVSTFRDDFKISPRTVLIGNVGNLYPVKGQRYLIQAFAVLRGFFPDSRLVLVGRGDERTALEGLVRQLGLPEGAVIFAGFRNDVGNILAALDIYVQPSLSEGLPVALLEALAEGLPVIATDVGGVAEVIGRDGTRGLLVPPGSSDELSRALLEIGRSLDSWKTKAPELKRHVAEDFSLEAMSRTYLGLFERVLSRNSPGHPRN